jgi:hypothetical protein
MLAGGDMNKNGHYDPRVTWITMILLGLPICLKFLPDAVSRSPYIRWPMTFVYVPLFVALGLQLVALVTYLPFVIWYE